MSTVHQLYDLFTQNPSVSTDSRSIAPGCLFFALRGEHFNGNLFAVDALEKGASVAVVDEKPHPTHPRIFQVENVLQTLQDLARHHRRFLGTRVLAITGSNGKTTTKELCRAGLSEKFQVHATRGNLNNHLGVPLTLLAMDHAVDFAIVEMGANHPGEIRQLCQIAEPDFGLITNIGKAHLEGFGSLEGVARAKGELFEYLLQNNKVAFVNEGNPHVSDLVTGSHHGIVHYNGSHGWHAVRVSNQPFLKVTAKYQGQQATFQTHLLGSYNVENVLAACAVGQYFGLDPFMLKRAIASYQPDNNRSQLKDTGNNKIFLDAYNANPSSMMAAIHEFLALPGERKMMFLGEMRELGGTAEAEHEHIVRYLRDVGVSDVILLGQLFKSPACTYGFRNFETTDQLLSWLSSEALRGYFILIKGSRSNQLEKTLALL
jgi:UDP-N-acetylmuramoyl-tripeptide--D-alanyl-D-alanine ligase